MFKPLNLSFVVLTLFLFFFFFLAPASGLVSSLATLISLFKRFGYAFDNISISSLLLLLFFSSKLSIKTIELKSSESESGSISEQPSKTVVAKSD